MTNVNTEPAPTLTNLYPPTSTMELVDKGSIFKQFKIKLIPLEEIMELLFLIAVVVPFLCGMIGVYAFCSVLKSDKKELENVSLKKVPDTIVTVGDAGYTAVELVNFLQGKRRIEVFRLRWLLIILLGLTFLIFVFLMPHLIPTLTQEELKALEASINFVGVQAFFLPPTLI